MTEVYEIIKQSLDNCTRMTEASKVDEATRVANKIVKLKDNPVPSIEKEVDEITLELANAKYYGASPDLCVRASNLIYELFEQNGVETNKEQPKLNEEDLQAVEEALLTYSDEEFTEKVLKYLT